MIFAKIDVTLPRHHRFLRIPQASRASALGVWTAAVCYSRGQELDGFCPLEELEPIATKAIVDWLVRVELFSRHEKDGTHGVLVLKYAEHNETKAEIDARRLRDRLRKHKGKSVASPEGIPSEVPTDGPAIQALPSGIHVESNGSPGDFPDSDSDSVFLSVLSERERGREPQAHLEPTPRLIDPAIALDEESREAAAILGLQEIDVQWRRFVDKSIARGEKSVDFRALFRSRLSFMRNDEARERRKDAATYGSPRNGPVDHGDPYNAPEAVRARERARDTEWRERQANAVRSPSGLAAIIANAQTTAPPSGVKIRTAPATPPIEIRNELTPAELEAKRQEGLRALEDFTAPPPKSGAGGGG